jgi:hypothetical protein
MDDDDYQVLESIRRELQAQHDEWYAEFDRAREDSRITHEDLVARHEQLIAEFERVRREHGHRFDKIDTAIENDRQVTRETLLEIREMREGVDDSRDALRAQTEGLLRVLDEFRRRDGPDAASA